MTKAEFQGEAHEERKKLHFLDEMTGTVSAGWLAGLQPRKAGNLRSLPSRSITRS